MPERATAPISLPERVTVLTCIGCGGMGRQERCDGECSEHKLVLVSGADHEALLAAVRAAQVTATRLAAVARPLADAEPEAADLPAAYSRLRADVREALRDCPPEPVGTDWASPGAITGWWCADCGNVDMPQPCIGVCIWRPADWVNVAVYERQLRLAEPTLRAARTMRRLLERVAAVSPRPGLERRNWAAFQAQARAALVT